jgi:hypothetical protein
MDAAQANVLRMVDALTTINAEKKELQRKRKAKGAVDLVEGTILTSVCGECGRMTSRRVVYLRGWQCLETRWRAMAGRELWEALVQEDQ